MALGSPLFSKPQFPISIIHLQPKDLHSCFWLIGQGRLWRQLLRWGVHSGREGSGLPSDDAGSRTHVS